MNLQRSASGCDPDYKSPVKQETSITRLIEFIEVGGFEFSYQHGADYIEIGNDEGYTYVGAQLNEDQVRDIHSFLSQWLEKNQKDPF